MILDTNAVSALFDGNESLANLLANSPRLSLPAVVVGEYRYGLARSSKRQHLTDLLETLIAKSAILNVDLATSAHYGIVRTSFEIRAGISLKTICGSQLSHVSMRRSL